MIEDDALSKLIAERRRRAACEAAGIAYTPDVVATRAVEACAPVAPELPDVLFPPGKPLPPKQPERDLPPPLIVKSPEVVVSCAGGLGGVGSSKSDYGKSKSLLYLDDLTAVTRSELYRIAPFQEELQITLDRMLELLAVRTVEPTEFDEALMAASTMERAAAAALREAATALWLELRAIATLAAQSNLVCLHSSPPLWLVCDSSKDNGYEVLEASPNPLPPVGSVAYSVPGATTSTATFAAAREAAISKAAANLVCVYFSRQITITCEDADPSNFAPDKVSYTDPFVWRGVGYPSLSALHAAGFSAPSLESLASSNRLVYSVPTSTQFSASTQEEADAKARAAALLELNCFFPSREVEVNCENQSAVNEVTKRKAAMGYSTAQVFAEMDEDYLVTPFGDSVTNFGLLPRGGAGPVVIDSSLGLIFKAPAGLVTSRFSQVAADVEAASYARGLLDCKWLSPAVTCSCTKEQQGSNAVVGSYLYEKTELDALKVSFNAEASTAASHFAKGELGASERFGDVDAESTMGLCKSLLSCLYCNVTIPPDCIVPWTSGDEGLPLRVAPPGASLGVTAGLPADVICESSPELVNTLAVATGSIPPPKGKGGNNCLFGNTRQTAECPPWTTSGEQLPYGTSPSDSNKYYHNVAASVSKVTIEENSVVSTTLELANSDALASARSALRCVYLNPTLKVLCGANVATAQPPSATFFQGAGAAHVVGNGKIGGNAPKHVVNPASLGAATNPVNVAYGTSMSLTSPGDAFRQALLIGSASLRCFFRNVKKEAACGGVSLLTGEPEEGTIFAKGAFPRSVVEAGAAPESTNSQAETDNIAQLMADSRISCLYTNAGQTGEKDCDEGETADLVTVAEGTVVSSDSTADANQSAKALADGMSQCKRGGGQVVSCPLCGIYETGEDKEDGKVTITGGFVFPTDKEDSLPIVVNSTSVAAQTGWYLACSIADGFPTGSCVVVQNSSVPPPPTKNAILIPRPGISPVTYSGSSQTSANYEGSGKGCGHLRLVRGIYKGRLVWLLTP